MQFHISPTDQVVLGLHEKRKRSDESKEGDGSLEKRRLVSLPVSIIDTHPFLQDYEQIELKVCDVPVFDNTAPLCTSNVTTVTESDLTSNPAAVPNLLGTSTSTLARPVRVLNMYRVHSSLHTEVPRFNPSTVKDAITDYRLPKTTQSRSRGSNAPASLSGSKRSGKSKSQKLSAKQLETKQSASDMSPGPQGSGTNDLRPNVADLLLKGKMTLEITYDAEMLVELNDGLTDALVNPTNTNEQAEILATLISTLGESHQCMTEESLKYETAIHGAYMCGVYRAVNIILRHVNLFREGTFPRNTFRQIADPSQSRSVGQPDAVLYFSNGQETLGSDIGLEEKTELSLTVDDAQAFVEVCQKRAQGLRGSGIIVKAEEGVMGVDDKRARSTLAFKPRGSGPVPVSMQKVISQVFVEMHNLKLSYVLVTNGDISFIVRLETKCHLWISQIIERDPSVDEPSPEDQAKPITFLSALLALSIQPKLSQSVLAQRFIDMNNPPFQDSDLNDGGHLAKKNKSSHSQEPKSGKEGEGGGQVEGGGSGGHTKQARDEDVSMEDYAGDGEAGDSQGKSGPYDDLPDSDPNHLEIRGIRISLSSLGKQYVGSPACGVPVSQGREPGLDLLVPSSITAIDALHDKTAWQVEVGEYVSAGALWEVYRGELLVDAEAPRPPSRGIPSSPVLRMRQSVRDRQRASDSTRSAKSSSDSTTVAASVQSEQSATSTLVDKPLARITRLPIAIKFATPGSGIESEDTRQYTSAQAVAAIQNEARLYTGPLKKLQGLVVPNYLGTWEVVGKDEGLPVTVYVSIMELLEAEPGVFDEDHRMDLPLPSRLSLAQHYHFLEKQGVFHQDVAVRHIAESCMLPEEANIWQKINPSRIEVVNSAIFPLTQYRIIDFDDGIRIDRSVSTAYKQGLITTQRQRVGNMLSLDHEIWKRFNGTFVRSLT